MTTETKLDCVFCKEVFDDKETLLVHFRKHGDPNFNTKPKSRPEELTPEKSAEDNEVISCDVCDEVFPTISKAITHKHKAHPDHDAKYFCPFCGKLFTMKHLYNKHIQLNHDSSEVTNSKDFQCDSCSVVFYVPSAMLYHNKFFHRQDTEVPAVGLSKKIKMYNQEMLQISYCAFCGEEFNNRINLHKHIGDDHADENQSPTEILRCPLCEAIFYHLDAYEVHLTFHSTEDLYSEQNEMVASVTEFSLETVAPIMEKVEEEDEVNKSVNAEGIDSFLQLVMGESADNDAPDKVKSKKHKKHKKSKKASITLDEFLNMNKDVFGDGLNVHGIEEVPTQVVLKKVKGKKLPNKSEPKVVNADLAKLKKQGIVVKTKAGNSTVLANLKKDVPKPKVLSSPNEILSKLMNQENSQIKIIKKSVSQNDVPEEDDNLKTNTNNTLDNNANTDMDVTDHHEEDKSLVDNNSVVNSKIEDNSEISDYLQEKEDLKKCDSSMLENSDEKMSDNEDLNESLENEKNIKSNNEHVFDGEIDDKVIEDGNSNVLNAVISSPNQTIISKSLQDSTCDFKSDKAENKTVSNDNDEDNDSENVANKTLDALKHLSHLITVKSLTQTKPTNGNNSKEPDMYNINEDNFVDTKKTEPVTKPLELNVAKQAIISPLIKLSEHITVKPSKPSPPVKTFNSDIESENEFHDDYDNNTNEDDETQTNKPLNKNVNVVKRLNIKNFPVSPNKISIKNEPTNETDDEEEFKNDNCPKKPSNIDILKRLSNVTAKPINTPNINPKLNIKQIKPITSQVKEFSKKAGIDQEVEIFNIDDSDSDGNESSNSNNKIDEKPPNSPMALLQNLGKNVVIKSNKTNTTPNNLKEKTEGQNIKLNKQSQDIQRSINLQNKLKFLGGNVTVKPSSSSPNMFNKEFHKNFDDYDDDEANDSGSETNTGKVKITEMQDDEASDDEFNESHSNALIESPHGSNSENEDNHEDPEDDFSDFENQIRTNTLLKKESESPIINKNTRIENFKNFNKELTIKSLNPKKQHSEEEIKPSYPKEATEDLSDVNKQLAIRQVKPNTSQNDPLINKSSQQQTSGSVNQASSFNKKVSTSSNQVNTVKTVKRFQSQTVIEEITTTVTKTIRTVNQSTNEVVQNRSQTKPLIRPQKINNQPGRQLQGSAVRFATPTVGTKIKNATVRNPNPNSVRPSNQLVPVRPNLCLPRPVSTPGPSTSGIRKPTPPRIPLQKPPIGKLKISPNALNQAPKRSSSEATGHFSCVKKSKETVVQSSEGDFDDDSAMQFSMTQSRSDFSSVSKTVKGKGIVTATQMRSEVNTCSQQQLSKLSNVSGLKIMKTSSKQSSQVEEKCEINSANKNTLEAIEKLQRHGLLIKKPRLEEYNEQPNSYSESDDETNEK